MDVLKWVGIAILCSILGIVFGGLIQVAVPGLPLAVRILVELACTAIILRPMIQVARIAPTIERHHGKQFD